MTKAGNQPTLRYFGEQFGTPLAKWLNGDEDQGWTQWARSLRDMGLDMEGNAAIDRKARARVANVIEELQELSRLVGLMAVPRFRTQSDERRLRAAEAAVNRSLKIYASHPAIMCDELGRKDGKLVGTISERPYNPERLSGLLIWRQQQIGRYSLQELTAVRYVGELIALGALERLRRCEACGRWMYARRLDAKLCSGRKECKRAGKAIYYRDVYKQRRRSNDGHKRYILRGGR